MRNRFIQMTTLFLACVAVLSASVAGAGEPPDGKVKVFILTGQSNMEGKGRALHLDTHKDDPLIKPTYATFKKDGEWVVRDDVWITYPTKSGGGHHRFAVAADPLYEGLLGLPPGPQDAHDNGSDHARREGGP